MIKNDTELLDFMTRPSQRLVEDVKNIKGDILILGCGGKIGPSLAITAQRAIDQAPLDKQVIGASLFDYKDAPEQLQRAGVQVIQADFFDLEQLKALPDVENIIYMVGRKFGTQGNPEL